MFCQRVRSPKVFTRTIECTVLRILNWKTMWLFKGCLGSPEGQCYWEKVCQASQKDAGQNRNVCYWCLLRILVVVDMRGVSYRWFFEDRKSKMGLKLCWIVFSFSRWIRSCQLINKTLCKNQWFSNSFHSFWGHLSSEIQKVFLRLKTLAAARTQIIQDHKL